MVDDLLQPGSAQLVALPRCVSGRVPRGQDYPDSGLVYGVFSPLQESGQLLSYRPSRFPDQRAAFQQQRLKIPLPFREWSDRMDLGDLRGMPKVSNGADEEAQVSAWRGESRSHSKGKEPAAPSEEHGTPVESDEGDVSPVHHCPTSMKDLFKTKVHKGDARYYTLQMSDLGYQDPDKEMKAKWRGLKNLTKVWNDSSAAEEFERGLLHPQLARELYTLPSEVLLARAAKEMVLVSSRPLSRRRKFSFYRVLINCCSVRANTSRWRSSTESMTRAG
ncbi:hypothetical protein B296_00049386 [Ensete ventricosum]|uniref:Uncharacterized protein n=1 Tax=Ensete ventricosum TaxID=4639 RepID=A0A426XAB7_ENSVE|nr:hypothetical protein B296_00049386 [Ensete ventricosum]